MIERRSCEGVAGNRFSESIGKRRESIWDKKNIVVSLSLLPSEVVREGLKVGLLGGSGKGVIFLYKEIDDRSKRSGPRNIPIEEVVLVDHRQVDAAFWSDSKGQPEVLAEVRQEEIWTVENVRGGWAVVYAHFRYQESAPIRIGFGCA